MKRLVSLLLISALLLGLAGCHTQPPVETTPNATVTDPTGSSPTLTPTDPTDPMDPIMQCYREAIANLSELVDTTVEVNFTEKLTVSGDTYTNRSKQTITYLGLGTEDFRASVHDTLVYADYTSDITETYVGGIAYTTVCGNHFSSEMTADDYLSRQLPLLLIDESLYTTCTAEENSDGFTLIFSDATGLEDWLATDGKTLITAQAKATVKADGTISSFYYNATYRNMGAETNTSVFMDFKSLKTDTIDAPPSADHYTRIAYLDGPRMVEHIYGYLLQAQTVTFRSNEQLICAAAGVQTWSTTTIDRWGDHKDLLALIDYSYEAKDYYNNESFSYKQVERFEDGKYTITVDDGKPTADRNVTANAVKEYILDSVIAYIYDCTNFTDIVCTDLGDLLLLEFTGDDEFAQLFKDYVVEFVYKDPDFLEDYASSYHTDTMQYYLGIDKNLGLPTSIGIKFTGCHVIDGTDYILDLQIDQGITLGSLSAYTNITDESAPDTQPDTEPTPVFYHITGADGQEMWLLGTIHVGDSRTGFLPQEIYDAFDHSDALAVEINPRTTEERLKDDSKLQKLVSKLYYYTDGSTAEDHIDKELYPLALKLLKANGTYSYMSSVLTVPLWTENIESYYLTQAYNLSDDKGVDMRLLLMAEKAEKKILEVETLKSKISMDFSWSDALTMLLLEEAIHTDGVQYAQQLQELYDMWCGGDEDTIREYLNEPAPEMSPEEAVLYEEYNNGMSVERDKIMIDKAIEYLESGETVFMAVGLAHVLTDGTLVDALRDAGYTVELVTYE